MKNQFKKLLRHSLCQRIGRHMALLYFFAFSFCLCPQVRAIVKPAAIFTDNAVLQREIDVPIWGTARSNEVVTVSINGQKVSSIARDGKWMARLKPMTAGGPYTLSISGENAIVLTNILLGEVWLCSGQSNMQWPLKETENGEQFIAKSKDDGLRFFTVPLVTAITPAGDLNGGFWDSSGPDSARNVSAVAYHFGCSLRKNLGVPVGLISSSYGGSIVQAWTGNSYIISDPESRRYLDKKPDWAKGSQNGFSLLYNGMIFPIIPFGIRGVIWYQGEGNTESTEANHYRTSFPLLIRNWREAWGEGDFPFLFVQLAPWVRDPIYHVAVDPEGTGWAVVREAQLITSLNVKNAGMVVITDLGDENRIHPKRKEPVGQRLALAARAIAYGENVVYRGPVFQSMNVEDSKVILSFEDASGAIIFHGDKIMGFTIAGSDKKFFPAQGKIVGKKQIEIWSDQVSKPSAVRYGWCNYPIVNMYNLAGLPMSPFRTDTWPPEKPFITLKLAPEEK
jgi:sialate O-acetylesterase